MSGTYIIALDQGTTSSRAILVDRTGTMLDTVQREFEQIYPKPGWVEHNPQDILFSQLGSLAELVARHGLTADDIVAIGIDNQRETTIVWDPTTGEPIANAIVWQCRRTAGLVDELCGDAEVTAQIRARTGLMPDAYFSASKLRWLLDNVDGARARAEAGGLLFGTVDSYLVWVLTGGLVHATDVTNASRTMLYNIHEGCWDPWLLELFDIPESMLPEVRASSGSF
ncbi:MAG TPA: FGGY family carbohydrate kinase, partial [Atopobiaceae bacterium]|nr:FGGY family carbohydrate kinase [Atopobiaceae bacterium]